MSETTNYTHLAPREGSLTRRFQFVEDVYEDRNGQTKAYPE
jgi:hypothetical protein